MSRGGDNLQVLSALDAAKTQRYHFTAIIVAGMGFFTDAYDLFCISLVTKLLGRIYYTDTTKPDPGSLPPDVAFCGTLAGQLFFGWLGDKLGHKSGMTLMPMVLCSIASGLSFGHTPTGVMATLCFFRFWLGFGIGGDYPLSATIMSEYTNKRTHCAPAAPSSRPSSPCRGSASSPAASSRSSSPRRSAPGTLPRRTRPTPPPPPCRRPTSCGASSSCSAPRRPCSPTTGG
uniref:Major facilitator superfamily (MFS) profile domain-containing protein n=1 Tax=Setaria viridis TaxID=4556 RepID=A0A4U6TYS4_SETVI|nr:hypothetical protein SEVIR_6G010275v2 [Setaria viridis]